MLLLTVLLFITSTNAQNLTTTSLPLTSSVKSTPKVPHIPTSLPQIRVGTLSDKLDIPNDVNGVHVGDIGILLCWEDVEGATAYQVQTIFPDNANKTFKVSQPGFVLKNARSNSTYSFRVRQWTGLEFSKFSQEFTLTTELEEETYREANISVDWNNTSTFFWEDTPTQLIDTNGTHPRLMCFTYSIETCLRVPSYREWTTNETLVSDVKLLGVYNDQTNKSEDIYVKNYTIHYDKHHILFVGYANISCDVVVSDQLRLDVDDLIKDTNYSYIARIYLGSRDIGMYDEGWFTHTGYIPPVIVFEEFWTGIVIYLVACGILIGITLLSFLLAIICSWERLMSDLAVKKDKMKTQRQKEMDKKLKAKLLTDNYINSQTARQAQHAQPSSP